MKKQKLLFMELSTLKLDDAVLILLLTRAMQLMTSRHWYFPFVAMCPIWLWIG